MNFISGSLEHAKEQRTSPKIEVFFFRMSNVQIVSKCLIFNRFQWGI